MPKATEKDVLLPALRIINKNPGCDMSFIIHQIENEMVFCPEDLEPLANRPDLKYSQIIRNLNSHYESGNDFSKYVNRELVGRRYTYWLNEAGGQFLMTHDLLEIAEEVLEKEDDWAVKTAEPLALNVDLTEQNNRQPVLRDGNNPNHRYATDPRVSQFALRRCAFRCEYAGAVGTEHPTFNWKRGNFYLEAHHLIPMKAQKDFPTQNLDREENVVGLCPNCHSAVHYGTIEEKVRILKPLYEARIDSLRNCEHHIDISFEDLINKYYL